MTKVLKGAAAFVRRELVLCIAVLLAIISAFFVPPSGEYFDYIDWDTLCQLFALMAVMKGFQSAGLFSFLAEKLLKRAHTTRRIMFVLVFLPFVMSMVITNDVALITFVPFALTVLSLSGNDRLAVPLVILQTIAANLGSMFTPIGNPQNLYLFARSGMSFGGMLLLMLPYVLLSAAGLAGIIMCFKSSPVLCELPRTELAGAFPLTWPAVFFVLCLLGLFNVLPPAYVAAIVFAFLVIFARPVLKKIDYSLLLTFFALFIFTGNLGALPAFKSALSSVISGNEVLVAVLASQVISNVPAALLLSGFTNNYSALIVGCNIGGLGTLIASMASLISFKEYARAHAEGRGKYLLQFTLYNLAFLAALIALYFLLINII